MVISEDDVERIRKYARVNGIIACAYVFGSRAAGRERKQSDIDIAIMIRGSIDGFERAHMETELSNLLGKDVDLVVFDRASPLLRRQIMQYGQMIYEADQMERVRQETAARWEYLDSRVLYRILGKNRSHG